MQLFAALDVASGYLKAAVKSTKNFHAFRSFIVQLIDYSQSLGKKVIHLILDNGSTHRPAFLEGWLAESYPNLTVKVTWLPVRSSWLNQIVFSEQVFDRVAPLKRCWDSVAKFNEINDSVRQQLEAVVGVELQYMVFEDGEEDLSRFGNP